MGSSRYGPAPIEYEVQLLRDAPSHYWKLGDAPGSTTALDLVGGAHGTISGGVTLNQPGAIISNGAMAFDGDLGKLVVPRTALLLADSVSWEVWVKVLALPPVDEARVVLDGTTATSVPGGVVLYLFGDGMVHFGGSIEAIAPFGAGVYHHLVGVLDRTVEEVRLYVDGQIGSVEAAPGMALDWPADAEFVIGNLNAPSGDGWSGLNGWCDEVAIYPRALTAEQIAAHYAARLLP